MTPAPAPAPDRVAELPGLDGAFSFPETLLQRIWARGEFDARTLTTRDGRPLRILRRGRWNRLGGPDFTEAEIQIGESLARETIRGSIEVHLRATDWDLHGHANDPAYTNVVLHVVLFPSMREWTLGAGDRKIPILELLPLLERDLEAYAREAAVEEIAGRPCTLLRERLAATPPAVLRPELERHSALRWTRKVALARARLNRLGWAQACHTAALEALGYARNRGPMLTIAEALPLDAWSAPDADDIAERALSVPRTEAWVHTGVRPANHPRTRLAAYARWTSLRPDWPMRLETFYQTQLNPRPNFPPGTTLRERRRRARLGALRRNLSREILADTVGGSRLDTLICDAFLPLLAARDPVADTRPLESWWQDWPPGDAPAELLRLAREFQLSTDGPDHPIGQGLLQGLLGWMTSWRDKQAASPLD